MPPSDAPKDVVARGPVCGLPIGQMHIVIYGSPRPFDTVSFYCNREKNHLDACKFVGTELVLERRRRD